MRLITALEKLGKPLASAAFGLGVLYNLDPIVANLDLVWDNILEIIQTIREMEEKG